MRFFRSTGFQPVANGARRQTNAFCRNRVAGHGLEARATGILVLLLASFLHGQDLVEHDGYRGVWVKTDAIEAFVATQPKFRILSIRKPDKPSLIADAKIDEPGVRLAFMSPGQVKTSFDPGLTTAEIVEPGRFRLKPADGMQYTVTANPETHANRISFTYELKNVGDQPRTVGCWSVTSFPCDGTIALATGQQRRARRRMVLSWWSRWPMPGLVFGRDAMSFDTAAAKEPGVAKIGLITDAGWVAFVRGQTALLSSVSYDPAATYPEDGPNITVFQTVGPKGSRAETEQMGPLKKLAAGESVSMTETFEIIELPQAINLPKDWAAGPAGEADALRAKIEAVLPTTRPSP